MICQTSAADRKRLPGPQKGLAVRSPLTAEFEDRPAMPYFSSDLELNMYNPRSSLSLSLYGMLGKSSGGVGGELPMLVEFANTL